MPQKIKLAINSSTTGKYRHEVINGREHLITGMVPIVGDTVMKSGFYPDEEVTNSFPFLNGLPAPNGHPKVDGEDVSAFHPLAVNAFNVGGFIRNPSKIDKTVNCDFCLDVAIANNTADGQDLISRIMNGGNVGVSTGLLVNRESVNGTAPDGKAYSWIARNLEFDHVAILLNEKAAGSDAGTKLQLNSDGEGVCGDVIIVNALGTDALRSQLNNILGEQAGTGMFVWIVDIFPDEKQVIFEEEPQNSSAGTLYKQGYAVDSNDIITLLSDKREVVKIVTFVEPGSGTATNTEETQMSDKDKKTPVETKPEETKEFTLNDAQKMVEEAGFVLNKKEDADKITEFLKKEPAINAILEKEKERVDAIRKTVVENSDLSEEAVAELSETVLNSMVKALVPDTDHTLLGGAQIINSAGEEDSRKSYVPNYEDEEKE